MSESVIHYLDHAATMPISNVAVDEWVRVNQLLASTPGNPSSLHSGGRAARRILDDARARIADIMGADIHEIIFTSGATESDSLAVAGVARGIHARYPQRSHVLIAEIEHDAVFEQRRVLEDQGFTPVLLDVDSEGITRINENELSHLAPSVAVASMSLVCSEIGTIQPVKQLRDALRASVDENGSQKNKKEINGEDFRSVGESTHGKNGGATRAVSSDLGPQIHTDASQALLSLDVNFHELGVDMMTISGHKVGAPVGIGALLIRRGLPVFTDRPGGGQERKIRSGTSDVAGAAAFAAALDNIVQQREHIRSNLENLRNYLYTNLPHGVYPTISDETKCSPCIVHLSLETTHPEAVLLQMDRRGVMVSAGSACHAGVTRPSRILMAMGRSEEESLGVLRISMGPNTVREDIDALLNALPDALAAGQMLDGRKKLPPKHYA